MAGRIVHCIRCKRQARYKPDVAISGSGWHVVHLPESIWKSHHVCPECCVAVKLNRADLDDTFKVVRCLLAGSDPVFFQADDAN